MVGPREDRSSSEEEEATGSQRGPRPPAEKGAEKELEKKNPPGGSPSSGIIIGELPGGKPRVLKCAQGHLEPAGCLSDNNPDDCWFPEQKAAAAAQEEKEKENEEEQALR